MKLQGGISGIGKKKPRINRDWSEANEKRGPCRNCGRGHSELAHIIGREHDDKPPLRPSSRWKPYLVARDRVAPLCNDCHQGPQGQHSNRLDLLSLLDPMEQAQAVVDAGGILQALWALSPEHNPKRVWGPGAPE